MVWQPSELRGLHLQSDRRRKISRELWERTMNDLLSNPAKLKNYPFQMDREKLND
ncbi:MAG: hypothetical protein ACLURV_08310 [Gallintestinimicrobium sp.]